MYNFEQEAKEIKDILVKLTKITEKGENRILELENYVQLKQGEVQDYLHQAELTDFNASEGYRIAKNIQDSQRTRREAKDLIELYQALEKVIPFKETASTSSEGIRTVNNVNKKVKCRFYKPRVRKDLTLLINKKNPQNVPIEVKEEYEQHKQLLAATKGN